MRRFLFLGAASLLFAAAATEAADEPAAIDRAYTEDRAPCAEYDVRRSPYFGDLHVHTKFSLDASTQDTRTPPTDAYRFAQGERIGLQPFDADGRAMRHAQLARPLDFAAVTDHAELIGEVNICNSEDLPGSGSLVCRIYRRWPRVAFFWMNMQAARGVRHGFCGPNGELCRDAAGAPWQEILDAAEEHYDRSPACRFTTFPGYEWTGSAGLGANFHRNVIFRNAQVPDRPTSFIDAPKLKGLWQRLDAECRNAGTGCEVLVIPHNSNLGNGMMFATTRPDGAPLTSADARERASYERLVEVMQHKGDSECHLDFSPEDELCGFEKLPTSSFGGRYFSLFAEPPVERQFLRRVLADGLALDRELGANPFQYGFIASTDTHLGTPGLVAESADYPGHGGAGTPAGKELPPGLPDAYDFNPGGLAVLWAEENSRDALFRAMWRREAYATSGPRIVARFFGGWDFPQAACDAGDIAAIGYEQGVPMGGELATGPDGRDPVFVVSALRDPGTVTEPGTPLQRIQIVKGWVEGDTAREKVFEIAGDPQNGATVDTTTCVPSGAGFDSLCSVWRDPTFDAAQHAFYYARIVENPTCRWSQKLCAARGVRCDDPDTVGPGLEPCCATDHRPVIQERAWTSPIWYRPTPGSGS